MRISLAQANATGALVNQHEPEPGATTASLCEHASGLFLTAINGTQNSLSPEAVEQAVDLMRAARQVFCLGQGGSMLLANDICRPLFQPVQLSSAPQGTVICRSWLPA